MQSRTRYYQSRSHKLHKDSKIKYLVYVTLDGSLIEIIIAHLLPNPNSYIFCS
jgi:hypothetical protein